MNQYILKQPVQPTCKEGLSPQGELIWEMLPMSREAQERFPIRYRGDFCVQWQRVSIRERCGFEFSE